jgi:2-polyprenyl-6-methoxyphenol hydroxylase-like FAD-dependent oxidoreductase
MVAENPVLVVGGGIGGLAAALALGRSGWRVRVLEEAPQFGAIGYGIQLGVRALTVADWTEAHMFDCLAWLYDGFAISTMRSS